MKNLARKVIQRVLHVTVARSLQRELKAIFEEAIVQAAKEKDIPFPEPKKILFGLVEKGKEK